MLVLIHQTLHKFIIIKGTFISKRHTLDTKFDVVFLGDKVGCEKRNIR